MLSELFFFWQTYIKSMDKDFVAATIQAIGRCATNIGEVRDTCLNGLVQLLSNRDGEFIFFIILYLILLRHWVSFSRETCTYMLHATHTVYISIHCIENTLL